MSAELWLSLEEHQYTLELIMGRYRKHMLQMMMAKEEVDTKPVLTLHEDHAKVQWLSLQYSHITTIQHKEKYSCSFISSSSKCTRLINIVLAFIQEVQTQVERICEMGQVMRRAMQVDDQRYCSIREKLAQLEVTRLILSHSQ